jgi:hypothetical protein
MRQFGGNEPFYRNVVLGYNEHYTSKRPIPREKGNPFILRRKEKKDGRRENGFVGRHAVA